jgi:hypothetical protein
MARACHPPSLRGGATAGWLDDLGVFEGEDMIAVIFGIVNEKEPLRIRPDRV